MSGDADGSPRPTEAELAAMSSDELLALGGKLDGVDIVFKEERWPVEGTRAEKRAERGVALWLLLGGVFGLALLLVFLFWPWEWKPPHDAGAFWYNLATPMYGLTFGLSILAIGIGAVLFQKKFIPEEITIQDRHDGASAEIHRKTIVANLTDALEGSTDQAPQDDRRSRWAWVSARSGWAPLVAFIGGLIKNPWKPVVPTAEGKKAVLWTSGWTPRFARRDHLSGPRDRGQPLPLHQDAARGSRRRRHGDGVPVAGERRRRHHRRIARGAEPTS